MAYDSHEHMDEDLENESHGGDPVMKDKSREREDALMIVIVCVLMIVFICLPVYYILNMARWLEGPN